MVADALEHDALEIVVENDSWRSAQCVKCLDVSPQEALERLIAGRTVFAIAHRLSTLRKASRLFVIADGRLIEAGTHAELMRIDGGKYRRLYELQLQLS